jgi:integrase/recombinase XerC
LVSRYAYDARLEDVTPHTLRHTFGKNLVDAGVPLDRVAHLLGHEGLATTTIYTTPSGQDPQRQVEQIALR